MAAASANPFLDELIATANTIASPGRGILAADESTSTIGARFKAIGIENNLENRQAYRELLFTTDAEWGKYISGVILYEETLFQTTKDGRPMVELIRKAGSIPGIKVDAGLVPIPNTDGETATSGLDKLDERARKYYEAGARFAKWRAAYKVSPFLPSELAIKENAWTLARYAAICQANGLVPIVEPEVLADGDHDIDRYEEVTYRVLAEVFKALHDQKVVLEAILLKPNMVIRGISNPKGKATPDEVARATLRVLQRTVPPAVPGILFLSGGQGDEEATLNLDAINKLPGRKPWQISFSYGRALQNAAQKAWKGQPENVPAAQKEFLKWAKANSQAQLGQYKA